MTCHVLPVIHHLDMPTSLRQADIAFGAGADGLFLISHHGADHVLAPLAAHIKQLFPGKRVGINLLGTHVVEAFLEAKRHGLDMLWGDNCGVSSSGLRMHTGQDMAGLVEGYPHIKVFAGVDFKGQKPDPLPFKAAQLAASWGFVPTTSGPRTGVPPALEKIKSMSAACDGNLANASGLTPENVTPYVPYLRYILVATGVSADEHHFDARLLADFVGRVKRAAHVTA